MKMKRWLKSILVVAMVIAMISGCSQTTSDEDLYNGEASDANGSKGDVTVNDSNGDTAKNKSNAGYKYEGALKFSGFETDFEVAYDEIFSKEATEVLVKHVSSTGEEAENTVKGVLLETLLQEQGLSQKDFATLRMVAGDGYAIDVTSEILMDKDIILAYEFDGQPLDEKKQPLRVAIDDVRSMFFVSNLAEIVAVSVDAEEAKVEVSEMILLETAVAGLDKEPFTYYESEDEAVFAADLIQAYVDETTQAVEFVASDGFEKSEDFNVVNDGFIKVTGDKAPLFTGKDLPIGMNVKYIMEMEVAETSFVSVMSALDVLEKRTVQGIEGVALEQLIGLSSIDGSTFTMMADDDYSVEMTKEDLMKGIAYLDEDSGKVRLKFEEGMPKNYSVKNLLRITASGEVTGKVDKEASDQASDAMTLSEWTITFDGLSDGSFDLTSEKAGRKLELVDLHTEHMKNDVKKPIDWQGYRLLDVLEFLHVESFEAVELTAGDGFSATLTRDQVDGETLLAVVQNGQALMEDDNKVQLVQNTEFASTWVKGLVKITVK